VRLAIDGRTDTRHSPQLGYLRTLADTEKCVLEGSVMLRYPAHAEPNNVTAAWVDRRVIGRKRCGIVRHHDS
jgi:hypothetical protein